MLRKKVFNLIFHVSNCWTVLLWVTCICFFLKIFRMEVLFLPKKFYDFSLHFKLVKCKKNQHIYSFVCCLLRCKFFQYAFKSLYFLALLRLRRRIFSFVWKNVLRCIPFGFSDSDQMCNHACVKILRKTGL